MNETELKILEAAEREFLDKGFAGARTTSIAEAAGVTHGMLHYYYRTKDKLFERVLAEKFNMLVDIFLGFLVGGGGSFIGRIETAVGNHFDFIASNPDLPIFIFTELKRDSSAASAIIGEFKNRAMVILSDLQRNIDEAHARGECCAMDAATLVLDIVSLNIFPFVAAGLIRLISLAPDRDTFLRMRRAENIETIIRRLKVS